jgi:hypothetical protein
VITQVWGCDFEFGEGPVPRCLVARDLTRGTLIRIWEDELLTLAAAPFPTDATSVMVAYAAAAEAGCFLALGWPLPLHCLDLFIEFRLWTNGLRRPPSQGYSLLGALAYFGLPHLAVEEKDDLRQLALRGGPWHPGEPEQLLDYCQTDVDALVMLWPRMQRRLGWPEIGA